MKNLIATLIVAVAATSALAAEPAKVEAVKKPEATAAAVPATPKEMPKVAKPKTKSEKAAEAKDANQPTLKVPLQLQHQLQQKPRIKKPKLLRSNPLRLSLIVFNGTDPLCTIDDEDIYVTFRRPEVPKFKPIIDDDEELSDYVTIRLAMAHEKAMQAFRNKGS